MSALDRPVNIYLERSSSLPCDFFNLCLNEPPDFKKHRVENLLAILSKS